jgi:hypothetical protein
MPTMVLFCFYCLHFLLFFQIPYSFSGEIHRWVDEKGTIHFTDDESKIPRQYSDQAEKIELQEQTLKGVEEIEKVDAATSPLG